jgi:hypothetical protein
MVEKKMKKLTSKPKAASKPKTKAKPKATSKTTKSKNKNPKEAQSDDTGIVIVDDDIVIDQEKVNEERRAYLEESRSQDAYD